ncbi:MAG: hypothetical protein ABI591_30595 [Kofleriaceae bacterium]
MRLLVGCAVVLAGSAARADVTASASIGAGAQGDATYGALELRLDQQWRDAKLGLGVRGVWDDGVFRRSDWSGISDAVTIVRDFEAIDPLDDGGHLAIAAGVLAPSHIARIADGYRSTLDDRWRTGVRTAAVTGDTEATLELDDVLDPVLIAGAVNYQLAPPYGAHLAVAIDPTAPTSATNTRVAGIVEMGASRRFESPHSRTEVGGSIIAELGLGFSAVGYVDSSVMVDDTRFTLRGDARGGSGTVGAMFGPLYRIERLGTNGMTLWQRARAGELEGGALGATAGVALPAGWFELGLRSRPGLGMLATASAGAPMSKRWQAAMWAAASTSDAAGAAELRVAPTKQLFSALQAARIYQFDTTGPTAVWSVTAWFGAATD